MRDSRLHCLIITTGCLSCGVAFGLFLVFVLVEDKCHTILFLVGLECAHVGLVERVVCVWMVLVV